MKTVDMNQIAEVYEIFDKDFTVIYVGRGKSARKRFLAFCRKHGEEAFGYRVIARFPLSFACETELTLIDLHKPKYNKSRQSSLGAYGFSVPLENRPMGDRNGSRTCPDSLARGDRNGSRTCPEKLSRGEAHSDIMLKVAAKGDRNGKYTKPEKTPRGESHGRAKITEQDVRYILSYKAQGCRIADVMVFMKLTRNTVSKIWLGYTWKHIK